MNKNKWFLWVEAILQYVLFHFIVFVLIIISKTILYIYQFGLKDSLGLIINENISDAFSWLNLLTVHLLIYPIVWLISYVLIINRFKYYQLATIFGLLGVFTIGTMYLITCSITHMFFHYKNGGFSIMISFIIGAFLFFPFSVKEKKLRFK